jgi:outer membrane protein W
MRRAILALSVVLCLFPVTAFAERPANYATAKLGAYFPASNDLEGWNKGLNGELAFGHYFNPNMAGEVGIGYFTTKADFAGVTVLGAATESDKITVYPFTVTGKAILPFRGKPDPGGVFPSELYIGAGIGAYFAKAKSDIFIESLGRASDSDKDVAFGAHIVAGGSFDVTPNIFLGVEGKYFIVKPSFSGTFFGVPIALDARLNGYTATANLGYRF